MVSVSSSCHTDILPSVHFSDNFGFNLLFNATKQAEMSFLTAESYLQWSGWLLHLYYYYTDCKIIEGFIVCCPTSKSVLIRA